MTVGLAKYRDFENPSEPKRGAVITVNDEHFVDLLECPNRLKLTSLPLYPGDYDKITDIFVNFIVIDEYSHPELYNGYPLWQGPVYAKII
jgi:hypothetical protein